MTTCHLSGYLSPTEYPPTFLIPTFIKNGSNDVFVQNLDTGGIVRDFHRVDCDLFYNVSGIPPHISLAVGQGGLIAYWADIGRVLVASPSNIVELLSGETPSDPFVELEIGALLGDREQVTSAASRVASIIGDPTLAERWKAREITTFRARTTQVVPDKKSDSVVDQNEKIFQSLLNTPEADEWPQYWLNLWHEQYKIEELTDIAFWWIDSGPGQSEGAGIILETLLRTKGGERVANYALRWLNQQDIGERSWLSIWFTLSHRKSEGDVVRTLGLDRLRAPGPVRTRSSYAWPILWGWMWRLGTNREFLSNIADNAVIRGIEVNKTFAEYVFIPLITHDSASPEIWLAVHHWLDSELRSTILWARLYLMSIRRLAGDNFRDLGIRWLSHYGGNMNLWYDMWKALAPDLPTDEKFDIGISWLQRARWDLTSWPKVFSELSPMAVGYAQISWLHNLGVHWVDFHQSRESIVKKIRQPMNYLQVRLETSE